jgi:hypothetical protein
MGAVDMMTNMNFGEAKVEMLRGRRVRRLAWDEDGPVYLIANAKGDMFVRCPDGRVIPCNANPNSLLHQDWVIVPENSK